MSNSKSSKKSTAVLVVLVIIAVLEYSIGYVLGNYTMASYPIVMCVSFLFAAIIGFFTLNLWRLASGSENIGINITIGTVFLTGFISALFYILNFSCSKENTHHTETAIVIDKRKEVRHKTKRISRRHYTQGEPYNVYYLDIQFNNGTVKPYSIKQRQYSRFRIGDSINVQIEKGLFGLNVIKRNGTPIDVPHSSYRSQFEH